MGNVAAGQLWIDGGDKLRTKREEPELFISRSEVVWRIGLKLKELSIDSPEIAGHTLFEPKRVREYIYNAIYSVPTIEVEDD